MNAELRLKDKFSYNILLRMTENFEEIFQLIKDDIDQTVTCSHNWLFINREIVSYVYEYHSSCSTMNSSTFTSSFVFALRLLHFFFSNQLSDFFLCTNFLSKNKSTVLSYRFFFKVILHCETWNVIGLFPLYKLEKIGLLLKPGPWTWTLKNLDPEEPWP